MILKKKLTKAHPTKWGVSTLQQSVNHSEKESKSLHRTENH